MWVCEYVSESVPTYILTHAHTWVACLCVRLSASVLAQAGTPAVSVWGFASTSNVKSNPITAATANLCSMDDPGLRPAFRNRSTSFLFPALAQERGATLFAAGNMLQAEAGKRGLAR